MKTIPEKLLIAPGCLSYFEIKGGPTEKFRNLNKLH